MTPAAKKVRGSVEAQPSEAQGHRPAGAGPDPHSPTTRSCGGAAGRSRCEHVGGRRPDWMRSRPIAESPATFTTSSEGVRIRATPGEVTGREQVGPRVVLGSAVGGIPVREPTLMLQSWRGIRRRPPPCGCLRSLPDRRSCPRPLEQRGSLCFRRQGSRSWSFIRSVNRTQTVVRHGGPLTRMSWTSPTNPTSTNRLRNASMAALPRCSPPHEL